MKRLFAIFTLTFLTVATVGSAFTPLLAPGKTPKKCCCQTERESAPADIAGLQLKNKPCGCELSNASDAPQTPFIAPTVPNASSFEILAAAAVSSGIASLPDQNVVIGIFAKQKIPAPTVPAYLAHCVLLI